MKLTSLILMEHFFNNLNKILHCQLELRTFKLDYIKSGDLTTICENLRSLEVLEVEDITDDLSSEFAQLFKLKKLKNFKLEFFGDRNINESISLIRSDSLTELDLTMCGVLDPIETLSISVLSQLRLNVPYLKTLKLSSNISLNVLNLIIEHLPIEELSFYVFGIYTHQGLNKYIYQDGPLNETLKELTIYYNHEKDCFCDLPKLIGRCKKLEVFRYVSKGEDYWEFYKNFKEPCGPLSSITHGNKCIKNMVRQFAGQFKYAFEYTERFVLKK